MNAVYHLTLLRLRTFIREPEALFWTFGFPILMAVGLGVAFREQPEEPAVVVVEEGSAGEGFLAVLDASREIRVSVATPGAAAEALRKGEAALVLSGADSLVFRYDPTRPESRMARLLADAAVQQAAGAVRPVPIIGDPERQPGSRYIDWVIPGLIGLNLMSTGLWGIGFGIVMMRQKKQLKRLAATPMGRGEFLVSQILARLGFLVLEIPPIILFAWIAFDVEIAGSPVDLAIVILLGTMTFAGIGLLASSRAKTIEGVSGIMNVIMLPMFIFSGVFFSSSRFPEVVQPVIQALPLTALNDAIRGVYNDGQSVLALGGEMALITGWMALAFLLAVRMFRWQ